MLTSANAAPSELPDAAFDLTGPVDQTVGWKAFCADRWSGATLAMPRAICNNSQHTNKHAHKNKKRNAPTHKPSLRILRSPQSSRQAPLSSSYPSGHFVQWEGEEHSRQ